MLLGYNTNGLAHHRLPDALRLLADEGYESVAITLDAAALDPFQDSTSLAREIGETRSLLERLNLARVVETGARYLLNPRKKHDPTLLDPDPARRQVRIDFLNRAVRIAAELGAGCVSLWSGAATDRSSDAVQFDRLVESLRPVLDSAERASIPLAFEPEPGMFIDTLERFRVLDEQIRHPLFQLTVDIGHVHCLESGSIAEHLRVWGPGRIINIHIEDMERGVHEHLMFGAGTIDFPPVIAALREMRYSRGLHVELSRHSHMAPEAVRKSAEFLRPLVGME